MKIKLDENLPTELATMLRDRGHDVHTVPDELLSGREDPIVFAASVSEERLLITQDLDFSDTRKFSPGSHPGLVLIRLKHPSRRELIERFRAVLDVYQIENWARCFVVLSDNKLRVRTPKP
jgi:predicted nuclease of predicted toxin-antitoxin system